MGKLLHILTGLALIAVILGATSTVAPTTFAQTVTADFRIIAISEHDGQLVVEVEHFKADGTFDYFENYMWQGREGDRHPRVVDADGYLLVENGRAPFRAPFRANPVTATLEQYLPDGESWKRATTPIMDDGSILRVIQQIHDRRKNWTDADWPKGQKRGQSRLTEAPRKFNQSDSDGIGALLTKFSNLPDTAYKVGSDETPIPYRGLLPPVNPGRGLVEYGTVSTFYPDASAVDGDTQRSVTDDAGATWANVRDGAGTASQDSGAVITLEMFSLSTTPRWNYLTRAFMLFDTAALPDTDIVSAATVGYVLYNAGITDDFGQSVELVTTTPASDTSLVDADYTELGTTLQATGLALAGMTANQTTFNYMTLNATGHGNVNRTGISRFGLRLSGDVTDTEPTWASQKRSRLQIAPSEETFPGDKRPVLTVTHIAVTAAITGTIGDGATEQEVRDGGGTIIVTVSNDTWVADGATFDAQRQNIIDGLDAADAQTAGWNAQVRDQLGVSSVVRTSDTIATITVPAGDVEDYHIATNETITVTVPSTAVSSGSAITATPTITITASTESAAITGTIGDGATEQEVRDGGGTILVTLTNTDWVADGATFNAQRQNIIDGLDAADAQAAGWNAQVRDQLGVSSVVRTSDTIATITVAAGDVTGYAIATNETITVTVPASAIKSSAVALTATPTITITAGTESAAITGTISDGATSPEIQTGGQTAIVTLTNTKWVADGATFNAQRQNIIDGFVSASSETNGWNNRRSDFAVTDVVRTSDIIATVTFSASSAYAISAAETITLTVPATAISGTALAATPTFVITPNYVSSGTWVSPAIDLSSIIDTAYCAVGWSESVPAGTSAAVEYSSDGGGSYSTATNGSCPFSIASSLAAVSDFRIRVTLTTTDTTVTPTITALGFIAGTTAGQTVRYQLNTTPALTATDRTGNGYSGTMSFPALPSGVSTTVGSMTALRSPPSAQTARGIPQVTSPVTGTAVSDNIFNTDETGWTGLPGYQVVNTMATAGDGLPVQFIWYIMLGLVTIMLGFFALNLTQSLFAAGVAMALGLGASIAMGGGLIPGWVIFVFIPVAVGMIFLRPKLAI